jgi:hypothetical protein
MTELSPALSDTTRTVTRADRLRTTTETGHERADDAIANALDIAAKITAHAGKYGEVAQRGLTNFTPWVAKSLNQRPMVTLAAGVAVGIVLGALWRK